MRISLPLTDDHELREVAAVLESGYLTQGPKTAQFERLVADYVGSKHAFAMSSCTTALHLALVALDVGEGDEVLVADFTFPATANVVMQQKAIPRLVDIELDTLTVDIDDLARKITPKTKAILPVHAFGCSADMDAILELAERHGIPVIEDAATAIGTTYKGRQCGSMGRMGCFSFHPRKVITTGEGGMITTNDGELADRISLLRSHGGRRTGYWFTYEAAGFNYRLSDLQAAVGVAQMAKLPAIISGKQRIAAELKAKLAGTPGMRLPQDPSWGGHTYQSFVVLLDEGIDREGIIAYLREHDVETTLGTYALHAQPVYQRALGYASGDLPKSYAAFTRTLTLPLYPQMTAEDVETVAHHVRRAMEKQ